MNDLIETIVYAGRLKDRSELMSSSSGGAFTALSDYFLERGNAVVAAVYNYENHTTEFEIILDKKQRESAKGSKYMQSIPGEIYQKAYHWLIKNDKKELLFVGMGCQSDGFRKFSELKGVRDRIYIVDIVCHGSPSPKIWSDYALSIQKRNGKITYLTFKDKRKGWKSPTAYVKVDGKEVLIKDYVNVFYSRCALRPSCYECPYATTERKTDMTIGDFWHIEKTIPEFYDLNGNSLFLIHTSRGRELFEKIKSNLDYKLSNTTQCWQANLEAPTKRSVHRDEFWNNYQKRGIDFVMKKYGKVPMKTKIKNKLLKIIGGVTPSSSYCAAYFERRAA